MKLTWAATAVALFATCLLGQTTERGTTKGGKGGSGAEQTLIKIEQEMLDGILKGDPSANERYMADDVVLTGPDGDVLDKARLNADIKSGALKLQSSTMSDMKVRVHGDTAVVTYGSTDKGTYKGKDVSGEFRWTDVFVRRNGSWQLVAGHGSKVEKR
jgi:ketosteroid isomerase-like protein